MHTVLMLHTKYACTECVLPERKNESFCLFLEGELYGMKESSTLTLENIKGAWYFILQPEYSLKKRGGASLKVDAALQNGDIWEFLSQNGEKLSIVVACSSKQLPVFQKYILKNNGKITIGKNPDNMIQYDFFCLVSGHHGVLEQKEDGVWVEDFSTNGIFYQGRRIYQRKKLETGEEITVFGLHILLLEDILCVCGIGEIKVSEELIPWKGQISIKGERKYPKVEKLFSPAPRQIPVCDTETIHMDLCDKMWDDTDFSRANPARLSFIRRRKKREIQKRMELEERERRFQRELWKVRKRYQENQKILLKGYPSAEECCNYGRESVALWNRNPKQEDFFFLRLGLGKQDFDVDIRGCGEPTLQQRLQREKEQFAKFYKAPSGISLKDHHLWGIVGGMRKEGAYSVSRVILAQILASYCYTDVKVGIVYQADTKEEQKRWQFAKWFPHIWSGDGRQRYLAGNKNEADEMFYEWNRILKKKENAPHFILFLDSQEFLSPACRKKYFTLFQNRVSVFLLVESFRDLPAECEDIIENSKEFQGVYHTNKGKKGRRHIDFDKISLTELTGFSKRLAEIRVEENPQEGELPDRLGFLELYQVDSVCDLNISQRWRKNATSHSMAVCIGKESNGRWCYLDVHERQDGCHGLLAGTTGSGKSEVLLTYLLSLAVNFSPSEVAFVLIDFKGGGMANFLKPLPHTTGCITNLSGSQVKRAMLAIKSENRRRQKLFARYRVNHISEYNYLWRHEPNMEAVPHLFLVVDEFAELKSHAPDFLEELIHIAQVGRSLGLHLILATQKPKGTVDENIWSNSRFRICLRVQTKEDSMEVLRKEDAACLTGCGQGYLQVGNEERYTGFQAGYTGNSYQPKAEREGAVLLTKSGKRELLSEKGEWDQEENRQTELSALLEYLCSEPSLKEFGRVKALWLPPLPEVIFQEEILPKKEDSLCSLNTVVGLCDVPDEQRQFSFEINFLEKGNYAVLGGIQSGKTTVVETLLWGLIKKYSPKELHLYLLDFNSKRLLAFEGAKQAGGVVTAGEEEKLERFFHFLCKIMVERREQLQDGSYLSYRQAGNELPAILVVLDDMENFRVQTKDIWLDKLYHIMRDGGSLGIYFFFTAGGFGLRGIPTHFREGMKECLALGFSDKMQYEDCLRRTGIPFIPEREKGRGLVVEHENVLEFQAAFSVRETDDYKRSRKMKAGIEYLWEKWDGILPKEIPNLPENLCLRQLEKNSRFQKLLGKENEFLIGYDRVEAKPYFVSLEELDGYFISGKKKTGKKNVLTLLALLGKRKGIECIFFAKRHSGLTDCRQWADGFLEEEEEWFACLGQIEEDRKKQRFLLVEDMKDFLQRIESGERDRMEWLSNLVLSGKKRGLHWIFALCPEDYLSMMQFEMFSTLVERERGIHLGGQMIEQKIFHYDNFNYKEKTAILPAGTGIVADKKQPRNGRRILCIKV